jgi:hypothetical protein
VDSGAMSYRIGASSGTAIPNAAVKIVEEWVNRDELNILAQLEAVTIKSA